MKSFVRAWVVMGLVAGLGSAAFAADEVKVEDKAAAEKQAQMERIQKLTSPSEAHKALEPLAGKWTYAAKFWMAPDAKPEETTGTAENTIVFGGRFVKQEVKGTWMNQPFEGIGYTGYDNIKGEYVSVWLDSMATGIMTCAGQFDAGTKTLKSAGENSCPLTGEKARKGRSDWTIVDANHTLYTSYLNDASGNEFKAMEITYTRAS